MRRGGEGRGEEGRERGVLTSPFRTSFKVGYLLTRKGCEQRSPATNTDTQGSHTQEGHLEQLHSLSLSQSIFPNTTRS